MARDTKQRILQASLTLFNELGEPNVTTNAIALSIDMSPGNLHYHFASKKDIVLALFHDYEKRIRELLVTPPDRRTELDDLWLLFHLCFEVMGDYQFIYRDLTDLCTRYPTMHRRFLALSSLTQETLRIMLEDLAASGAIEATKDQKQSLVASMQLISHFWLANDRILSKSGAIYPHRAVALVIGLIVPFLRDDLQPGGEAMIAGYE